MSQIESDLTNVREMKLLLSLLKQGYCLDRVNLTKIICNAETNQIVEFLSLELRLDEVTMYNIIGELYLREEFEHLDWMESKGWIDFTDRCLLDELLEVVPHVNGFIYLLKKNIDREYLISKMKAALSDPEDYINDAKNRLYLRALLLRIDIPL